MAKAKYTEWLTAESLTLLEGWARLGLSDEQIAHNMGINVSTLYTWKKEYPDIDEALKKGKAVVDFEVENATYKNACGHYAYEETYERVTDKETGESEMVLTKRVKRYIPPNPTSQIFWLKCRMRDVYKDKWADDSNAEAKTFMNEQLKALREAANNDTAI